MPANAVKSFRHWSDAIDYIEKHGCIRFDGVARNARALGRGTLVRIIGTDAREGAWVRRADVARLSPGGLPW